MTINELQKKYYEVLDQQIFIESELDYAVFEKHKAKLELLAEITNSGISVFDCFQKKHIFYSPNFFYLLHYEKEEVSKMNQSPIESKIHPSDYLELFENGIEVLKYFFTLPQNEKADYKYITEYRMLDSQSKYVRVIEQFQALELDNYGNIWLALSTIDVSPNQENYEGVKSRVINFKTGKTIPVFQNSDNNIQKLTKRELEILQLINQGHLSKEISDKLSISLHTVNTHRQNILKKLGVDNSIEAIKLAAKLGLLE